MTRPASIVPFRVIVNPLPAPARVDVSVSQRVAMKLIRLRALRPNEAIVVEELIDDLLENAQRPNVKGGA